MNNFIANIVLFGAFVSVHGCSGGGSASSTTQTETENGVAVIGAASTGSSSTGGTATTSGTGTSGSSGTITDSGSTVDSNTTTDSDTSGSSGNTDSSNTTTTGTDTVDNNPDTINPPVTNGGTGDNSNGTDHYQTGVATALEGVWIRECVLINQEDPSEGYRIWVLTFEGSRFSSYIRNFTTPGCTSASAIYSQVVFQGYFFIGEDVISSEGLPVTTIDVHTQTPIESVEYDIFYLTDNKLYFGDTYREQDGLTVENRPTALNFYWDLSKAP